MFPFKDWGIKYEKCTEAKSIGRPWCATEVDYDMTYLNWGYCGPNCP